ncbi:MAG: hypothetical protein U5M51_02820 [Emticicia sp.]|nr:hypothetical protein [Emticicia sp.]
MKNIFKIFALLVFISDCFGQQAILLDSKSITIPKYANQTAINAIVSPAEGAMVFDVAQDRFAYYTGSTWLSFPAASGPPSNPNAIVVPTIAQTSELTTAPLNTATNGSLVYLPSSARYYLRANAQWQEVNPSTNFWTVSGNFISNTTNAIDIGTNSTSSSANVTISNQNASATNPDITFQSPNVTTSNSIIKYVGRSGITTNNSIFTQNIDMGEATMNWQYTNASNATSNIFTANARFAGNRFYGFTNIGSGSPAVKIRLYQGGTNVTAGATTAIIHGLTASKIIDVSCVITSNLFSTTVYVLNSEDGYPSALNSYKVTWDATNINIVPASTSSILNNKTFKLLVTYTN